MKRRKLAGALVLLASMTAAGCPSLGPNTIARDRFDYGEAIATSFKEQMLLNVVRLRYVDPPLFVDVSSVINQYSLEGEVNGSLNWVGGDGNDVQALGGHVRYGDRPTITYAPLVGQKFTKSILTPLPPGAILFLVQSGWSVEIVFRMTVQAVNGVYNRMGAPSLGRGLADPDWDELIAGMARIQRSGAIGMRVESPDHPESAVIVFRRRETPEIIADLASVRRILKLPEAENSFHLTYGADASGPTDLAVQTRSIFEIMAELASQVDVPEVHVAEGRTQKSHLEPDDPERLVHIHSGEEKPAEAFVSVRFRDHWFWIDDRDLGSKRTFTFLMLLYNVTQTGEGAVPLLTIPT